VEVSDVINDIMMVPTARTDSITLLGGDIHNHNTSKMNGGKPLRWWSHFMALSSCLGRMPKLGPVYNLCNSVDDAVSLGLWAVLFHPEMANCRLNKEIVGDQFESHKLLIWCGF
jgi:hypothetical protein